jgi:hypothetical protein
MAKMKTQNSHRKHEKEKTRKKKKWNVAITKEWSIGSGVSSGFALLIAVFFAASFFRAFAVTAQIRVSSMGSPRLNSSYSPDY